MLKQSTRLALMRRMLLLQPKAMLYKLFRALSKQQ
nr:MAG TPA: hypothetical protein [Caudoviricetes sp.]